MWDAKAQRMIYPDVIALFNPNTNYSGTNTCIGVNWDDDDLMQFTGRIDKNGTEIYDGDILHTRRSSNVIDKRIGLYIVKYDNDLAQYNAYRIGGDEWDNNSLRNVHSNGMVVGNVYENPELVK